MYLCQLLGIPIIVPALHFTHFCYWPLRVWQIYTTEDRKKNTKMTFLKVFLLTVLYVDYICVVIQTTRPGQVSNWCHWQLKSSVLQKRMYLPVRIPPLKYCHQTYNSMQKKYFFYRLNPRTSLTSYNFKNQFSCIKNWNACVPNCSYLRSHHNFNVPKNLSS